ncbi:DUF397 domain-containing protein [Streptomyces sp. NBC_00847]|uniref:DUF397 domain-containing protein n=1 Tax=unclassified Streptomyces TaxID=2593676 RepID=UPI002259D6A8|nr:DUF397 domain-containing protein [Streptomyces sp. NBC_00847]MCX4881537.1 DUF397 domain-containing protein [Streptomyces sp. NBC_00847]
MASHEIDLSHAQWHKSSYSNGTGGDCVEVAPNLPDTVPVRDTKTASADGAVLLFPTPVWTAFVTSLKD